MCRSLKSPKALELEKYIGRYSKWPLVPMSSNRNGHWYRGHWTEWSILRSLMVWMATGRMVNNPTHHKMAFGPKCLSFKRSVVRWFIHKGPKKCISLIRLIARRFCIRYIGLKIRNILILSLRYWQILDPEAGLCLKADIPGELSVNHMNILFGVMWGSIFPCFYIRVIPLGRYPIKARDYPAKTSTPLNDSSWSGQ